MTQDTRHTTVVDEPHTHSDKRHSRMTYSREIEKVRGGLVSYVQVGKNRSPRTTASRPSPMVGEQPSAELSNVTYSAPVRR